VYEESIMAHIILLPITARDIGDAVAAAPAMAATAENHHATVLVLETDCLHGLLVTTEPDYEAAELRRFHSAAEEVAGVLRQHGATVETAWECVRTPRRPVDAETVRRHGADAVFLPHIHRRTALLEGAALRRLRREGIEVLEAPRGRRPAAAIERPPGWDD
jgi:hypothetical protein